MKTLFEAMRDFNARNASENAIHKMFAEIAVSALLGGYFLANNTKVYQWILSFIFTENGKEMRRGSILPLKMRRRSIALLSSSASYSLISTFQ